MPSVRGGPGIGGIIANASAPATLAAKPPTAESFAAGVSTKNFLPSRSMCGLLLVFHPDALPTDVGDLIRCKASPGLPFSVGLTTDWALGDAVMALSVAVLTAGGSCSTSWRSYKLLKLHVQHIQTVLFQDACDSHPGLMSNKEHQKLLNCFMNAPLTTAKAEHIICACVHKI